MTKLFTFEEAQARLPELRRIFALCAEIRARAQARVERLRTLEGGGAADAMQLATERSQVEFLAKCLEEALGGIPAMGALLQGLDPGLVDFPHVLDSGEEVLLCWREGEPRIGHYHGPHEGFSGRKPLPQNHH